MPSIQDTYQYEPLTLDDDIRLLTILPGDCSEGISCTLSHVSFSNEPLYEALSYTWGSEKKTKSLVIEGAMIPITLNLFAALRRLRCIDRRRIFWIDAICINQDDIAERNQQVPLMKSIFSKAGRVVVWLGEEVDTDRQAFDIIRMFEVSPAPDEGGGSTSEGLRFLQSLPLREEGSRDKWDSLFSVLHRPWYDRIWVIQEVVMAREVRIVCGTQTCSWAALIGMATAIMHGGFHVWMGGVQMSSLLNMASLRRKVKKQGGHASVRESIVDLIYATRYCGCTNPHDRVYALLGLVSEQEIADVVVDYGTPYLEVYKSLTINTIQGPGGHANLMLSMAGYRTESLLSKLPTWVPDWSFTPVVMSHQLGKTVAFNATGDMAGTFVFSECGKILTIRGFVFDVVRDVASQPIIWGKFLVDGPGWENLHKSVSYEMEIMREIDEMSEVAKPYPTGQDTLQAVADSMTCNQAFLQSGTKYKRLDDQVVVSEHQHYQRQLDKIYIASSASTGTAAWERLWRTETDIQFQRMVNKATTGRKFCVSAKRYIGWVPATATSGDVICVLFGIKVPYVLRAIKHEPEHYILIGECYLHGIMEGEATAADSFVKQDFKIR